LRRATGRIDSFIPVEKHLSASEKCDRSADCIAPNFRIPNLSCSTAVNQPRLTTHKSLASRADEICFQFGRGKPLRSPGQSGQTTKTARRIRKGDDRGTVKVAVRRQVLGRNLNLPDRAARADLSPLKAQFAG
jgi:hypothetical protein